MLDLQIQTHFGNNIPAKQMHLPVGHAAPLHKHDFDHLSILAMADALVEVDGVRTDAAAGNFVTKARAIHPITAQTDSVRFGIHATGVSAPKQIDQPMIEGDE